MVFTACRLLMTMASVPSLTHSLSLPSQLPLTSRVVTSEGSHSSESAFAAHLQKHGRDAYSDPREFQERFALYQIRAAEVEKHNRQPNRLWTVGLNHLSDRTDAELKQLLGYKGMKPSQSPSNSRQRSMLSKKPLPEEKSYGSYANQRFIRDQGQCGSCWAVTASTVLAAHSELWGTNRSFSTQEIVDCVPNPNKCGGKGGCDGATVELAMQYAMMKGLRQPSEYGSYKARDGLCDQTINDKSSPSLKDLTVFDSASQVFLADEAAPGRLFGLTGWEKLATNKYQPLMEALYFKGPVAVSIAANSMFSYKSGIFDGCTDFTVNHAVTLVGYGKEKKNKFFEIQNSWGSSWGEGGRFRVRRRDNEEKHCGMDDKPEEGVACEGDSEPVNVCGTCGLLFDSVIPHFGSNA